MDCRIRDQEKLILQLDREKSCLYGEAYIEVMRRYHDAVKQYRILKNEETFRIFQPQVLAKFCHMNLSPYLPTAQETLDLNESISKLKDIAFSAKIFVHFAVPIESDKASSQKPRWPSNLASGSIARAERVDDVLVFRTAEGGKVLINPEVLKPFEVNGVSFTSSQHFAIRYASRYLNPGSRLSVRRLSEVIERLLNSGWVIDERLARGAKAISSHRGTCYYIAGTSLIIAFTVGEGTLNLITCYRSEDSAWFQKWREYVPRAERKKWLTCRSLQRDIETSRKSTKEIIAKNPLTIGKF
jgi:hypothetical protein